MIRAGFRVFALLAVLATTPCAQMPGQPVIQNAFSNPGITLGVNFGRSSKANASGFAGAAAWSPSSARFQISGGAGIVKPDEGDGVFAWGARAMLPISLLRLGESFGVAAFAGAGGASDNGISNFSVPAGVAFGYRRQLGSSRGISVYATPFYSWSRVDGGDIATSGGFFRASFGLDVTIVRSIGFTAGYEVGGQAQAGEAGPLGDVFGLGVSYAFR